MTGSTSAPKGSIVTRFAPSPTGYLHIGGARTALFNWAFARGLGGKFLLRIEDTDKERSSQAAIDAILESMEWLGLDVDEEPVFQSKRSERHAEVAAKLLETGHAYRSYGTEAEIEAIRAAARDAKVAPRYPGRDDPISDDLIDKSVVRLKAPIEGETVIDDLVQGRVVIRNDQLDDLVLLRSDGSPTYMLAVIVDDHDMGITHVIRGDDHLTNCARQIQIYKALGWHVPEFAHIPLIHGADGAKLSKRHGALGAEAYKAMGYLPDAMCNYLARLGWSHGDEEIIPPAKLVELFNIEGINKAAARFDVAKLDHINSHYIRSISDEALIEAVKALYNDEAIKNGLPIASDKVNFNVLQSALPFLKERAKTLIELLDGAKYLFTEIPLNIDDKAQKNLDKEGVKEILSGVFSVLEACDIWDKETIEQSLKQYASDNGLKFGNIAPPIRSVLTGSTVSPGIYDVLYSLGKEESLKRIEHFI